ncbi:MAG TPA: AsnC family transcriptional regulator [Nitrososphaeraceae archaeon]
MKLLSRDSRTPYRNIASEVGIMPSAVKERINKMVTNSAIRSFVLFVNPVILGYEKECILTIRYIDKTIKEQEMLNKISLLGDVLAYISSLDRTANFILSSKVEGIFAKYSPVTMKVYRSDLKIMKCLLSDPKMSIENIAKATLLSPKTVARRLEKMRENHVLQFSVVTNLSSMNLTGYIEFAVVEVRYLESQARVRIF